MYRPGFGPGLPLAWFVPALKNYFSSGRISNRINHLQETTAAGGETVLRLFQLSTFNFEL
jgi:hypothetical protein